MIIPIELRFKADKGSKSVFQTGKTIKSHDVNSVEFHISIDGLELTDNYTAKILSFFHSSKSQANMDCEIVEGKIIYKPDTNLISMYEHVTNYVYVYNDNQSLDVREFIYTVDLSKIDETSLEVKEVYDQSYADLLADFEQALNDYKDSLPQADSVRAEIDVILNQFSEDSQAKLSQYDAAETDRLSSESTRKTNETTRISNENARKSAEVIRLASEADRVSAENVRAEFYEGFDGELDKKANKQQEAWITPTLLNGFTGDIKYRKTQFGHLEIYGTITSIDPINTTKINVFLLPLGYQPARSVKFEATEDAFYSFKNAKMHYSAYAKTISIYNGQGGSTWEVNVSIPIN